jgi:hypothetical protein
MRTLQECKDEIARKEGHADWLTCCFRENLTSIELIYEQVAKLYASEACREQREICGYAYFQSANSFDNYKASTNRAIENAPEPEMK